jgi:hypothetical protein
MTRRSGALGRGHRSRGAWVAAAGAVVTIAYLGMRFELAHAICRHLLIFFVKLRGRPGSEVQRSIAAGRSNYRIGNEVIVFESALPAPAAAST